MSDLHLENHLEGEILGEITGSLEALAPDLILLCGDLVDHSADALEEKREFFEALHACAPVVAIFGNHEIIAGADLCQDWLEEVGIHVLRDQWFEFEERLSIFGSRDLDLETPRFTEPDEARFPAILMAHNPDLLLKWPDLAEQGFCLALSGHTHGGQIRLPLIGPLFSVSDPSFRPGYNDPGRGLPPLIISKGVGYAAIPVRIACPPDIILVELA